MLVAEVTAVLVVARSVVMVEFVALVVFEVVVVVIVFVVVVPMTAAAVMSLATVSSGMVIYVVRARSQRMNLRRRNCLSMNLNQQLPGQHFALFVGCPMTYRVPLLCEVVVVVLIPVVVHQFAYERLVVPPQE